MTASTQKQVRHTGNVQKKCKGTVKVSAQKTMIHLKTQTTEQEKSAEHSSTGE